MTQLRPWRPLTALLLALAMALTAGHGNHAPTAATTQHHGGAAGHRDGHAGGGPAPSGCAAPCAVAAPQRRFRRAAAALVRRVAGRWPRALAGILARAARAAFAPSVLRWAPGLAPPLNALPLRC